MKIQLIVIGRTTDGRLQSLIDDYVSRLTHYIPFQMEVIPDLRQTKSLTPQQQKEREGQLLLERLAEGDWLVLFDENGREMGSVAFSQYLENGRLRAHGGSCWLWAALTAFRPPCMRQPRRNSAFRR